jgi:hypothetical protein
LIPASNQRHKKARTKRAFFVEEILYLGTESLLQVIG